MKSFWHYNEDRIDGGGMLAPMMLFSEQATLWGPSGKLIEAVQKSGECGISKDGFLELLTLGKIRVAARTFWIINGDNRKKSTWELAEWDNTFDGAIQKIFEEDSTRDLEDRRVFSVDDEYGYKFADNCIESRNDAFFKAREYYRQGFITRAMEEKIKLDIDTQSLKDEERELAIIRLYLRDARNHDDARSSVGAEIAVEERATVAAALADIVDRPHSLHDLETEEFDIERFRHVINFAAEIAGNETVDGLLSALEDTNEMRLIHRLMNSRDSISDVLRWQIEDGYPRQTFVQEVFGSKLTDQTGNVIGAAATVYSAGCFLLAAYNQKLSRRNFLAKASVSAAIAGLSYTGTITNLLEHTSLINESDYTGPKWYFLLKCGKDGIFSHQINEYLDHLKP